MRVIFNQYSQDDSGSTMPIFVLSLMGITALVGATIALGMDSRAAGNLQATADSAALSGATAFINVSSPKAEDRLSEARQLAKSIANSNSEYVLANLEVEAIVEDAYGQHTTIDVEMTFEPVNAMAKIVGRNANVKITRSAKADATWGFPLCMLALSKDGPALSMYDRSFASAQNCIIWSNSTSNDSLNLEGGRAEAKDFCTAGNAIGGHRASPMPTTRCEPIPNPLEDWRPPAPGMCEKLEESLNIDDKMKKWLAEHGDHLGVDLSPDKNGDLIDISVVSTTLPTISTSIGPVEIQIGEDVRHVDEFGFISDGPFEGWALAEVWQLMGKVDNVDPEIYKDDDYFDTPTLTMTPGTYCGLDIAYGHVKFKPGTYFIKDAPLTVRRKATLSGEGVTIILTGEDATFAVNDSARLDIAGPTNGPTAGFVLAEDVDRTPDTDTIIRSRITGDGKVSAIGTVYLPNQRFSITGKGAGNQASPLLQIVADEIDMRNDGELKIVFDTSKTDVPAAIKPERTARLVN